MYGTEEDPEREAVERSVRAELPSLGALLETALAEQRAGGAPFAERGGDTAAAEACSRPAPSRPEQL